MKNNELARDPEVRRMALAGAQAMVRMLEDSQPAPALMLVAPKKKRTISEAGRKRIAAAVKRRWRIYHQEKKRGAA